MTKTVYIFVGVTVESDERKTCKRCGKSKLLMLDFYMHKGTFRGTCKKCIVSQVSANQKKKKPWLKRAPASEERKAYMKEYYKNNKEKFKRGRLKFQEKNPDYYKDYSKARREESVNEIYNPKKD